MGSAASANDDACSGRGPSQSDFPAPACVHHDQQQTAPEPLLGREKTAITRTSTLASGSFPVLDAGSPTPGPVGQVLAFHSFIPQAKAAML